MKTLKTLKMGLCQGRHDIPDVDGYIFQREINPLDTVGAETAACERLLSLYPEVTTSTSCLPNQADYTDIPVYIRGHLDLYVTGLTMALVAALNACRKLGIVVTLYHYDREGGYYPQIVV